MNESPKLPEPVLRATLPFYDGRDQFFTAGQMHAYARAAVEAEREQCAQECDALASVEGIAQACAAAIRARNREDALQRLADLSREMGEEL